MLNVRCTRCKKMIPTGMDLDFESYRELTYVNRKITCPDCGNQQTWNVDDVDQSVFAKPPK
jgi:DNA-directed RNA polymerase subunit RPC12/RpoP